MNRGRIVLASVVWVTLLAGPALAETRTSVRTDHHVHLHSPATWRFCRPIAAVRAASRPVIPPSFNRSLPDVAARVHAANALTVATAAAPPGRLVAFVSVNPLAPDALSENSAWKGPANVCSWRFSNLRTDSRF